MIGTLTVFLPLFFFVLIGLHTVVLDRVICIRVAGGPLGGQVISTLLVVYSGGIFVVGVASAVGTGDVRSIFGAGLDLLVPCVLRGFSLWTVISHFLNFLSVFRR